MIIHNSFLYFIIIKSQSLMLYNTIKGKFSTQTIIVKALSSMYVYIIYIYYKCKYKFITAKIRCSVFNIYYRIINLFYYSN